MCVAFKALLFGYFLLCQQEKVTAGRGAPGGLSPGEKTNRKNKRTSPHAVSAASARFESETQPKMPPCALIISSATRWNSAKYEPTQSDSTTHS